MPKLAKNMYTTAKGERKLNCYLVTIPKEIAKTAGIENVNLKITAEKGKVIIEKKG